MKILVISDIHEHFDNLQRVLLKIPDFGVEKIFCLGDIINGGIGQMLAQQKIPSCVVWGNNDGNKLSVLRKFLESNNGSQISDFEFEELKIDNKKIFITHYPLLGNLAAKSGDYDAVFYGHDHIKHQEIVETCLLLNPGDICGSKTGIGSYGVYDTHTNSIEIYDIVGGYGVKNLVDI